MKTLTVDDRQRIRLPDAKPKQVFSYEPAEDGSIRLLPVRAEGEEAFPPGSLNQFLTKRHNTEVSRLAKASSLRLPK